MRQTKLSAAPAAPHSCELRRVRSAIGVRLIASFPPAGPARLGTRVSARAPGSGSPVPASSRANRFSERALPSGNKKPSGASGSGGFASDQRTVDLVSGEIVPMSQARAIDRPKSVRQLDAYVVSAVHPVTHVVSQTLLPARARDIRLRAETVNRLAR